MTHTHKLIHGWLYAWILCALTLTSCSTTRLPRIDPTGRRLFQPAPATTQFVNPLGAGQIPGLPRPAFSRPDRPLPCPQPGIASTPAVANPQSTPPAAIPTGNPASQIIITPATSVAPIGTEVMLLAGIRDTEGNYLSGQLLDWTLPVGGPSRFTATRQAGRELLDWLARQGTGKATANHVTSVTANNTEILDRGTETTQDDLVLAAGQSWVRLTSAVAGTSQVSVTAPRAARWNRQPQTATIYWVDAQWQLPASISAPLGKPQTLTTTITRRSTGLPLAGWTVRYEVLGQAQNAQLGDQANKSLEVTTNAQGQASIQVNPTAQQAGFTQVQVQISRPAATDGSFPQLNAYQGWTTIAWSSPRLNLQTSGPARATVGSTLQYKVTLANTGDLPANNVILTDQLPAQLKLTGSSLAGQTFGDSTQWLIGDIPARTSRTLVVQCRAQTAGDIVYSWQARSDDGMKAQASSKTSITTAKLDVSMTGPESGQVGKSVQFNITIRNNSTTNLENIVLSDRFDEGLQHVDRFQTRSAPEIREIRLSIPRLAAGQSIKQPITFYLAKAGRQCHQVEVTTPDGQRVQVQKCVTAIPQPKPDDQPPGQPVVPKPDNTGKNPDIPNEPANPVQGKLILKISDFSDPIQVGSTVKYVITLKNDRNKTDQRVAMQLYFPANLELQKITQDQSTDRPDFADDGRSVRLPKVKEILAGETLSYEVVFKAVKIGPAKIRAEVTSTRSVKKIVATEETTINPK